MVNMLLTTAFVPLYGKTRDTSSARSYFDFFHKTTVVHANYVVYGPAEVCVAVRHARRKIPYSTVCIEMNWEDVVLMCEQEWGPHLLERVATARRYKQDVDTATHAPSVELILMWCAKVLFVKRSMATISSEYHGWIDVGFKEYREKDLLQKAFPCENLSNIPKGKVVVVTDPGACHPQYFHPPQNDCVIGGIWFGEADACNLFIQACCDEIRFRLLSPRSFSIVTEQDIYTLVGNRLGLLHVAQTKGYDLPWLTDSQKSHASARATLFLFVLIIFSILVASVAYFHLFRKPLP